MLKAVAQVFFRAVSTSMHDSRIVVLAAISTIVAVGGLLYLIRTSVFQIRHVLIAPLVLSAPLCPLFFIQGLAQIRTYTAGLYPHAHIAGALPNPTSNPARVVWVVFDEWDYRLTFEATPQPVKLPEVERLASESLFATHAYKAGPATAYAIPSLIDGRRFTSVDLDRPDEVILRASTGDPAVRWGEEPNIFSRARAAGFNTHLIGWYLPYCRSLGTSLSTCDWWPMDSYGTQRAPTVGGNMVIAWRSLIETEGRSLFGRTLATDAHIGTTNQMVQKALESVQEPTGGLWFVHLPFPHAPFLYNGQKHVFEDISWNGDFGRYFGNLVLVDDTLGEFRRRLERAGLWDSTTLLFTTDHPLRLSARVDGKTDDRVPFILKLAHQDRSIRIDSVFDTTITADLLKSVLLGQVSDPQSAVDWIHAHSEAATRKL
jgi:hypothetical protein